MSSFVLPLQDIDKQSKFTGQPPRWSRAEALALCGEIEEVAHVHPGEEIALSRLQSNKQEGRDTLFTTACGG